MLAKNVMLDARMAIIYFISPLIVMSLLGLCIFFNCKTWKKIVMSAVILAGFLGLFFPAATLAGWTQVTRYEGNEAAQQYSSATSKNELMPDLSEIGETTNIEYYNAFDYFFIFSSETDYLICQYSQEEYDLQKARLDTAYTFQTKAIVDEYATCEPMAEINGYQFKMLSVDHYELYHPKKVVLIGYSDAAREIVYLNFFGTDLDYISSLKNFILNDCGWKYIR